MHGSLDDGDHDGDHGGDHGGAAHVMFVALSARAALLKSEGPGKACSTVVSSNQRAWAVDDNVCREACHGASRRTTYHRTRIRDFTGGTRVDANHCQPLVYVLVATSHANTIDYSASKEKETQNPTSYNPISASPVLQISREHQSCLIRSFVVSCLMVGSRAHKTKQMLIYVKMQHSERVHGGLYHKDRNLL